ncbi:hypothetical protein H4Q26_014428 [Puccinia striiformis f. sp. tritici PST-130]|nr:hypothetical protein H4Q26_014428 [Puccinia striiformis f. sp. tritici PST-130]
MLALQFQEKGSTESKRYINRRVKLLVPVIASESSHYPIRVKRSFDCKDERPNIQPIKIILSATFSYIESQGEIIKIISELRPMKLNTSMQWLMFLAAHLVWLACPIQGVPTEWPISFWVVLKAGNLPPMKEVAGTHQLKLTALQRRE